MHHRCPDSGTDFKIAKDLEENHKKNQQDSYSVLFTVTTSFIHCLCVEPFFVYELNDTLNGKDMN